MPAYIVAPLRKFVVSGLTYGQPYGFGQYRGRPHPAVDLFGRGAIRNMADGLVVANGNDPRGYGHYLVLQHWAPAPTIEDPEPWPFWILHAHAREDSADFTTPKVGMYICAGAPIALLGNTGSSTGPHWHGELRLQRYGIRYSQMTYEAMRRRYLDPLTALRMGMYLPFAFWPVEEKASDLGCEQLDGKEVGSDAPS